jgi:hypothetical protein
MVSYCLLMLYQGYHSVADILLTGLMTLPVLIWLKYLSYGKRKANNEFGCDL